MLFQSRSTNTLSRQHPRPSILMAVNWLPWSVLKMSGVPYRVIAFWTASRKKSVASVLNSCHDSTRWRAQSSTANKYTKSRCIGSRVRDRARNGHDDDFVEISNCDPQGSAGKTASLSETASSRHREGWDHQPGAGSATQITQGSA